MNQREPGKKENQRPLLILGTVWLLLGAAILVYQLSRPAVIEFEWYTETEFLTAGFHVYRSETIDGDYVRVNEALIPSQADPASGAHYVFRDENVKANQTYYYLLEDVEYSNTRARHEDEIIAGEFERVQSWALLAIPISILVGLVLIFSGLRPVE